MSKWDTSKSDFTPAPVGLHRAVSIAIIELGTKWNERYSKYRTQLYLNFELSDELFTYKDKDENEVTKPYVIGKFFTQSLVEKANLRIFLESWRGHVFTEDELTEFQKDKCSKILGKPCMLNVIHNEKKNAEISAVTRLAKGMDAPNPTVRPYYFDLEEFVNGNDEIFKGVPKGFQNMIKDSEELKKDPYDFDNVPKQDSNSQGAAGGETEQSIKELSQIDDFDDQIPF